MREGDLLGDADPLVLRRIHTSVEAFIAVRDRAIRAGGADVVESVATTVSC